MALQGYGASFLINSVEVAELRSVTNSVTGEELDITTFDSGVFKEFIQGLVSGQIDVNGFYDPTDTNGQMAIINNMLAGTNLTLPKILVDGTNGIQGAQGVSTSFSISAAVDGLVEFSATIRLSGTISVVS